MENTTLITTNSSIITTNMSSNEHPGSTSISWQKILLGTILYIVVFITIAGNALVLIAVYKVKKLQTVFNFYIVNLAVTDIGVASTAMSFYTIDNILGYWPFGEFMCGLWIFCDYGMTFASVFTLLVISVDRFWSVSWSVHYRANHNKRKSIIAIIAIWAVMVALWLPACIVDRVKNAADKLCIWEPSLNPEYVFVIALIGHHGACFVLLFCYLQVFFFMKKRAKIGPVGSKKMTASTSNGEMSVTATTQNCLSPTTKSNPTPSSTQTLQVPNTTDKSGNKHNIDDKNDLSEKRERKVFVTLSYILFGYVICWVPFHIVFDVSAINPDAVPQVVFTITFWMTYLNSAINPFLYNFSSPEFKNAFRKILLGK